MDTRLVFTADDTEAAAALLHDFNVEFDAPTPGSDTIAARLAHLIGEDRTFAVVTGA